jgi:predicted regulator of Ras-like GTPase activity (Roadblock/LC7/MglB family)
MGTYNILRTTLTCPHCHKTADVEIELSFGDTRAMDDCSIGDPYKWIPQKAVQNGGRPEKGDLDGEGYGECPSCHRDFFVKVFVRRDIINGVEVDFEKSGYISPSGHPAERTLPDTTQGSRPIYMPDETDRTNRQIEHLRMERQQLKTGQEALFNRLSEILFHNDPIGISFGDNTDEYEAEAGTILPRLASCQSREDVQAVVYEEFSRWFGSDEVGLRSEYEAIASEIWEVWQKLRPFGEYINSDTARRVTTILEKFLKNSNARAAMVCEGNGSMVVGSGGAGRANREFAMDLAAAMFPAAKRMAEGLNINEAQQISLPESNVHVLIFWVALEYYFLVFYRTALNPHSPPEDAVEACGSIRALIQPAIRKR